jgi:hypothetical protein
MLAAAGGAVLGYVTGDGYATGVTGIGCWGMLAGSTLGGAVAAPAGCDQFAWFTRPG